MRFVCLFLLVFSCQSVELLKASNEEEKKIPTTVSAAEQFDYSAAVLLGIVEGVTEFLPVSSTGHLIVASRLLQLDKDVPVHGKNGEPLYVPSKVSLKKRLSAILRSAEKRTVDEKFKIREDEKEPLTLKAIMNSYIIIIQFGAIFAVFVVYWERILNMAKGLFKGKRDSYRLARNLVVAFLPAAIIGFLFNSVIEKVFFGIQYVIGALFLGGILMLFAERWYWRRRRYEAEWSLHRHKRYGRNGPDLHQLSYKKALIIGFCQCLALIPGTSRSMATICGGYFVGLSPAHATEFSFLLGLITLSAASLYKGISSGGNIVAAFHLDSLFLGLIVAAVTAFFAVKWMINWINKHGIAIFAWYRILLALLLIAIFLRQG
ncbi:MAG: undecaprenyl-diphosphate phosphatase [Puniceicoccales bacterium]|jgi:undecaprenyl-diphosphatase|nr:undecaprenyl-diphosphate phosphatase [Puniceicoccales bacterium]